MTRSGIEPQSPGPLANAKKEKELATLHAILKLKNIYSDQYIGYKKDCSLDVHLYLAPYATHMLNITL